MELKVAEMHSQTNTPQEPESRPVIIPRPNLAISDTMALFAMRDEGDEAAGDWLRYKYRPFVAHIARRQFTGAQCVDAIVEESLRRAIELLIADRSADSAAPIFARVALQHCSEIMRGVDQTPGCTDGDKEERS